MLVDYRLTPDDLNNNWTDELLALILKARNERLLGPEKPESKEVVNTTSFLQNVNGFGGGGIGYERR
jgi:hypothetical protein